MSGRLGQMTSPQNLATQRSTDMPNDRVESNSAPRLACIPQKLEKSLGIGPLTPSIIRTRFRESPRADPFSGKCGIFQEATESERYVLQHMPGPHTDVGLF